MQIKKMASMNSRTGRQYQRYSIEGCRQVVGSIPYRLRTSISSNGTLIEELQVLLISSQKSSRMMFPKGGWENDETMKDAALRETIEEAGVDGIVECKLGTWSFESSIEGKFNEAHMFSLRVIEELDVWPEQNARQRIWMSVKEASIVCAHSWMKEALKHLEFLWQSKEEPTQQGPCQDKETCAAFPLKILPYGKEEETQTPCAVEFWRTESPMRGHNGEEDVDCCLA